MIFVHVKAQQLLITSSRSNNMASACVVSLAFLVLIVLKVDNGLVTHTIKVRVISGLLVARIIV